LYCHKNGISHRDLKPDNFMLKSKDLNAEIKIVDFGSSRKFKHNEKMITFCGTSEYLPPDIMLGDYDYKCDVWSLGVCLYISLCGYAPFYTSSGGQKELFNIIQSGKFHFNHDEFKSVSNEAKNLIKKMLVIDPKYRPSIEDIIEDDWFKTILPTLTCSLDKSTINSLKAFKNNSKFKKLLLHTLVDYTDEIEIKKLN